MPMMPMASKNTLHMANLHNLAIARTLDTISSANLDLTLVSNNDNNKHLGDYKFELEDDD
jgi:hypothetical protein